MNSDRLIQIPDLSYYIHPDGPWIDLEQNAGCGEVDRITLHRIHLRLLLEEVGHLLPPPSADELITRISKLICDILGDLANETGISAGVDRAVDRLTALVEMLPDYVFQSASEKPAASERLAFELTHSTMEEKQ